MLINSLICSHKEQIDFSRTPSSVQYIFSVKIVHTGRRTFVPSNITLNKHHSNCINTNSYCWTVVREIKSVSPKQKI